jgi:hypothetical protein
MGAYIDTSDKGAFELAHADAIGTSGIFDITGAYSVTALFEVTVGDKGGGVVGDFINIADAPVPGPVVGAGLPGLLVACGGLIALARRRRRNAA